VLTIADNLIADINVFRRPDLFASSDYQTTGAVIRHAPARRCTISSAARPPGRLEAPAAG